METAERIAYGTNENQYFELGRPQRNPAGAAVMVHGGFWRAKYDLAHARPFGAALAARGVLTANLEYRRVGQPGGGWPGTFEDVIAGVKAASEHMGEAPVVIGHSAGGHLALLVASEGLPLRAVVALAPVADLRHAYDLNLSNGAVMEFLGATPESDPERYDRACPSTKTISVPRVLVHGTEDEDVPIVISRAYVAAHKDDPQPPKLIEIAGGKHMELIDPSSAPGAEVIELVVQLAQAGSAR